MWSNVGISIVSFFVAWGVVVLCGANVSFIGIALGCLIGFAINTINDRRKQAIEDMRRAREQRGQK